MLQFLVCWGRREVRLSQYGLNYQSEVVSEFEPLRGPRCRDRETRVHATSGRPRTCRPSSGPPACVVVIFRSLFSSTACRVDGVGCHPYAIATTQDTLSRRHRRGRAGECASGRRYAVAATSARWRGGRRDDSARRRHCRAASRTWSFNTNHRRISFLSLSARNGKANLPIGSEVP